MKKTLLLLLLPLLSFITPAGNKKSIYNCFHGRRELIGYIPDVFFRPHVSKVIRATYHYQQLDSTRGFCGVYARSITPGVYLMPTYGGGSGATPAPPFEWVPIGPANGGDTHWTIELHFNGSAPDGTVGMVEIASLGCDACELPRVYSYLGSFNVYISAIARPTWFTVAAKSTNISSHRLILDHPYLNDKPNAKLFITPVMNSATGPGVYDNHPVSVWYNTAARKWNIQHDDLSAMRTGTTYNVRIDPSAERETATRGGNILLTSMFIRNVNTDNNPNAVIFVTPVDNGVKNPHPIAVRYIQPYWAIYNTDGAAMPAGASFNIRVMGYAQYISEAAGTTGSASSSGARVDVDGASRTNANKRSFNWASLNGKPNTQVIITPNWNPLNIAGVTNAKYTGASYITVSQKWCVFNESQSAMPGNASFNVWTPYTLWETVSPIVHQTWPQQTQ